MDVKDYVPQEWVRERLKVYDLIKKLKEDNGLRGKWIKTEVWKRRQQDSTIDEKKLKSIIEGYLEIVRFDVAKTKAGKITIRIRPKMYKGDSYEKILGMDFSHLTTSVKTLVETATQDVIRGYGKASILKGLFGKDFSDMFNTHIKDRMREEFDE